MTSVPCSSAHREVGGFGVLLPRRNEYFDLFSCFGLKFSDLMHYVARGITFEFDRPAKSEPCPGIYEQLKVFVAATFCAGKGSCGIRGECP